MAKLVSKVYGDALFESALERHVLEETWQEALVLQDALAANPGFIPLLNHPKIVREEKLEMLNTVLKTRVSEELMGFLTVMIEKGRQSEIPAVLQYFDSLVKEYKKIGIAYITSAVELKEAQKQKIMNQLLATTKYQTFETHYSVDPELIGGLVIRVNDRVADSSIRTKLYSIRKELMHVQA